MKTSKFKYTLIFSVLVAGSTAISSQIMVMRQSIVAFYGNELSLGIVLASWLFWVGIGSWVGGRFIIKRLRSPLAALISCHASLIVLLPALIFGIRNIKNALNAAPGEILSLGAIILSSLSLVSFLPLIVGFLFSLSCHVISQYFREMAIGRVYVLEAAGSVIGGLMFNFIFIENLSSFQIAVFVSSLNLLAAYLLFITKPGARPKFTTCILGIIFLLISSSLFMKSPALEELSLKMRWKGLELIQSRDSRYGNIAILRKDKNIAFYQNGLLSFTTGDRMTTEESVHYAMLEHPRPKRILLIGGGLSSALREILKYDIDQVDYVELDPMVIEMSKAGLPREYTDILEDERVKVFYADGRRFVKDSRGKRRYDVIITNVPDPLTAQLNRFYSFEYFSEIRKILNPDGVFSFGVTSSENYLNPQQLDFLACIYNTLKLVFADIKILPGDTNIFLASPRTDILTYDYDKIISKLKNRGIKTKFVREYYIPYKLSEERISYVEKGIKEARESRINYDLKPIGYLYDIILWSTYFESRINMKALIGALADIKDPIFFLILPLLFALFLSFQLAFNKQSGFPVTISILTTGFSEILFEIVVILAFQATYGYVYYRLILIITSFMLGLALGGWYINGRLIYIKDELKTFAKLQLLICIYPLILPFIFYVLKHSEGIFLSSAAFEISFTMLPLIAGIIGGAQFPLASQIRLGNSKEVGGVAGLLYGADLSGSCIGAIFVTIILIPIIGITQTCIWAALLNLCVFILLIIALIRRRPLR